MLNKVQIIGRLGNDPEIRYAPSGDAIANLSVATSETWKDKDSGERREKTEWHRIVVFGKLAEIVGEYLKKGDLAYFEGKLETRKWKDSDNVDRYTTEIKVTSMGGTMKILQTKGGNDNRGGSGGYDDAPQQRQAQARRPGQLPPQRQQPQGGGPANLTDMDDDIPF